MKTQILTQTTCFNTFRSGLLLILFMGLSSMELLAQSTPRTVTGVVKSLDGPVPFATIMLKGTTIGISADENGSFTFPKALSENDILVASSLGYENGEVLIKKGTVNVEPFLADIPLIIVAALRTKPSCNIATTEPQNQ